MPGQNVVIRATDADIVVILLYHARRVNANVWMDVGHSSLNTRRFIHITRLADHLGPILCKALPGYHTLTGCDYTSSFFRKGKVNPLKIAGKKITLKHWEVLERLQHLTIVTACSRNMYVHCMVRKLCHLWMRLGWGSSHRNPNQPTPTVLWKTSKALIQAYYHPVRMFWCKR